ncbi:hypothetical protein OH76DRAFT_1416620 [Lentinus brumalis]|uniref:SAP domain-containing protein n=1 Tax=Lentinus brumalis TaxID=2498619 RepID=A0A371DIW0_9APHY|nr:hypothetical protein OH76DRAFT_1416620 [Polyporus brumalis]
MDIGAPKRRDQYVVIRGLTRDASGSGSGDRDWIGWMLKDEPEVSESQVSSPPRLVPRLLLPPLALSHDTHDPLYAYDSHAAVMATTTTQILFNSPALHSLKRDQLVKLCKIHSIKANGKNVELIRRLKQRAQELPPDAALPDDDDEDPFHAMDIDDGAPADSDAGTDVDMQPGYGMDSEDSEMQDVVLTSRFSIPRPSEQWEIVMEDIAEADETMGTASSKDSLRTALGGEFGTHSSKERAGDCELCPADKDTEFCEERHILVLLLENIQSTTTAGENV